MSAPVDKLTNSQCAVKVGTPIVPLGRPNITFKNLVLPSGEYEATIKFNFIPDAVYDSSTAIKLPTGTDYAVLKLSTETILTTDIEVRYGYKAVSVNDFSINIDFEATIPGEKGNHG